MADDTKTATIQDFVASFGQSVIETEEQALSVYYQMRSYPELQQLLDQHNQEIVLAIQTKDTQRFIGIIQKVQSDFLRKLSEQPYQVQLDAERKIKEAQISPDELASHVDKALHALGETQKTAESVHDAKQKKNKDFIERLVKNYSKLTPAESEAFANAVVSAAETHLESSPQDIVQQTAKEFSHLPPAVVREFQKKRQIIQLVQASQKNSALIIEQYIVRAALESQDPTTTILAIQTYKDAEKELPELIKTAQTLAQANVSTKVFSKTEPDYSGFFSTMSKTGSVVEKALAPIADTVFSLFPPHAQEAIVLKVFGTSWNKEVSNNSWLQQTVGPLLQSPSTQQAIRSGNALFQSGGKNVVFTKTQVFFVDIFITIFHPQVSEVYLQLSGIGSTQMSQSAGSYYAGWLAQQGVSTAAKKGVKVVGTKVAEKAAGTTFGKILGAILGGEAGPLGSFLGSLLVDKIVGGLWRGIKKGFNFLTLGWLGNLVTGNYESTPVTKDPVFIVSAVLVCLVALPFVFPLLPFILGGGSLFQQTVQDNAYIAGLVGGIPDGPPGINTGAGFSCSWSGETPPTTSISYCPVHAPITQGPNTLTGSHINTEAYDFGCSNGTPIHAAQDGYVTSLVTTFQPNQFENKSFGNNVVLIGATASGQTFCTIYAHLLDVSPAVISAYQNKTIIRAGDIIGYSDTTGYTYGWLGLGKGPHLHFGYKGPDKITLPAGCP